MTDYANEFASQPSTPLFIPDNEPFDQPTQFGAIGAAMAAIATQCIALRRQAERAEQRVWELDKQNHKCQITLAAKEDRIRTLTHTAARSDGILTRFDQVTLGLTELVFALEERRNAGAATVSLRRVLDDIGQFFQPAREHPSDDA